MSLSLCSRWRNKIDLFTDYVLGSAFVSASDPALPKAAPVSNILSTHIHMQLSCFEYSTKPLTSLHNCNEY